MVPKTVNDSNGVVACPDLTLEGQLGKPQGAACGKRPLLNEEWLAWAWPLVGFHLERKIRAGHAPQT